MPHLEELRSLSREDLFASFEDIDIRPMPGGCLVSMTPKGTKRRRSY